jgi:tubulin--tyrosine ligase-like protein 12
LIDDPNQAEIIWSTLDYYNLLKQQITVDQSKQYINQFEFEAALVMKNHLANLIRFTLKDQSIIQETFILNDFLPAFVGRYKEVQKKADDNTWILKPVNMARSMDTFVSNNLDGIIRMVETGPKIAQKYIHNPCVLRGKKFDLRYVALLKSLLPLEVYVYDEFYTRFSNNPFSMDESSF